MNIATGRLAFGLIGIGAFANSFACCSVAPNGEPVLFTKQQNIVVWDEAKSTEHFVRNASFSTKAKDFGFIAPTPSIPELAEARMEAFSLLANLEPNRIDQKSMGDSAAAGSAPMESAPDIVQVRDVAGYRATTLKATDAAGLAHWMVENGYSTSPAIEEWTKHYIKKGWYLTAFKVLGDGREGGGTGAVRMSFKTDRPFNPYFVPKENEPEKGQKEGLQLYFISPSRYSPDSGILPPKWVAPLNEEVAAKLADCLKLDSLPNGMIVSSFIDLKFPNAKAKDDVYFHPSPMNLTFGFGSFVGSIAIAGFLGGLWYWNRRQTLST